MPGDLRPYEVMYLLRQSAIILPGFDRFAPTVNGSINRERLAEFDALNGLSPLSPRGRRAGGEGGQHERDIAGRALPGIIALLPGVELKAHVDDQVDDDRA